MQDLQAPYNQGPFDIRMQVSMSRSQKLSIERIKKVNESLSEVVRKAISWWTEYQDVQEKTEKQQLTKLIAQVTTPTPEEKIARNHLDKYLAEIRQERT